MSEYKYKVVNGKRVPEHRAVVEELLGIAKEYHVSEHVIRLKLLQRQSVAGDRTMLFALFSISSYDGLVPQILAAHSEVWNTPG